MVSPPRIVFIAAAFGVALPNCAGENLELDWREPADAGTGQCSPVNNNAADGSAPDADSGTVQTGFACPGTCVPWDPVGEWDGPALLWQGNKAEAPPCPPYATSIRYRGNVGLMAPADCVPCTCGPPTGSCSLPLTLTAAAATCANDGPGVAHFPFDAPASWNGACTPANAIPSGNGVASISIGPLGLVESDCTPEDLEPGLKTPVPSWKTYAFACYGDGGLPCPDGSFCLPTSAPLPQGFRLCVFREDLSKECPAEYPNRHIFFEDYDDGRTCSGCSCGPPEGSTCSAQILAYEDSACKVVQASTTVTSAPGSCVNVISPGAAMGSKSASEATYAVGACAPIGGEPGGTVFATEPALFCCRD